MSGREPVGPINSSSNYGSGYSEETEFIRCVDGRESQVNEVWTFGEDVVTLEVHPTSQVDVGDGFVGEFAKNYLN